MLRHIRSVTLDHNVSLLNLLNSKNMFYLWMIVPRATWWWAELWLRQSKVAWSGDWIACRFVNVSVRDWCGTEQGIPEQKFFKTEIPLICSSWPRSRKSPCSTHVLQFLCIQTLYFPFFFHKPPDQGLKKPEPSLTLKVQNNLWARVDGKCN